jgi:hypothetical protein
MRDYPTLHLTLGLEEKNGKNVHRTQNNPASNNSKHEHNPGKIDPTAKVILDLCIWLRET